jgi:4-diphosphocytidyl-2-C-methyl-D-erythritol kinase
MIRVRSAAKINLFLHVLFRREDGFHELRTRFQTLDLGDDLEVEESGELSLEVDDPTVPSGPENLVWRAAGLLREELGRPLGARMMLRKRIPAGGGLGGGSGDAAAALVALDRLWGGGLGPRGLHPLAARLGSDVPFFLLGGTALGTGRGERLEPEEDLPGEEILLVMPGTSLPTPRVYGDFASHEGVSLTKGGGALRIAPPAEEREREWFGNDLEPAVFRLAPGLARLAGRIGAVGAKETRVTGSGSCLFGRFDGGRVPAGVEEGWPEGVRLVRTRFLGRAGYLRGLGAGD